MKLFDFHTHRVPLLGEVAIYNAKVEEDVETISGFVSIGIHPWYIDQSKLDEQIGIVANKVKLSNVLAIGECGLDKVCSTDFKLQIQAFEAMIAISERVCKPLIIHCVKAFDELIAAKIRFEPKQTWVIHGFRGNEFQAKQLLSKGFCFSIGEKFNANAIKVIPLNSLFLETDESSVSIESIYQAVAFQKGISVEELSLQVVSNVNNRFKIDL
jgi:TatD DNase family protein